MVHPIKMNLEHPAIFLEETEVFNEDVMEEQLAKHMEQDGFIIGQRDVHLLDNDGFAKMRASTFGASDSAVLLGVAYSSKKVSMKTPEDLLTEKINEDWDDSIGMKPAVRKGKELEPMIIDKITDMIGGTVLKPKHMYVSTHGDGLATNFDGVVFEAERTDGDLTDNYIPVPMEIKVCSFFGRSNYNWHKGISEFEGDIVRKLTKPREFAVTEDNLHISHHVEKMSDLLGIPKYYYTQLQQQMMFLNAPHGYLAVMDDIDWTLYFYRVPRDEVTIKALGEIANELYSYLERKKK